VLVLLFLQNHVIDCALDNGLGFFFGTLCMYSHSNGCYRAPSDYIWMAITLVPNVQRGKICHKSFLVDLNKLGGGNFCTVTLTKDAK